MKDTKEIVLFFDQNTRYEPIDVAKELKSRFPDIGNPVIFPITNDLSKPIIIFNENPDFIIQANFISVNFVIRHSLFKDITNICFDIVDSFQDFKVDTVRMGYISNIFLSPNQIDIVKEKYLNLDELSEMIDFNIAWYKELDLGDEAVNCWERFIINELNVQDLICQYDINTKMNDKVDINMKYIKKFIKCSDEYIEKRIDL